VGPGYMLFYTFVEHKVASGSNNLQNSSK